MSKAYLEEIDGVLHYESEQDGVVAYRPCPPELVALILESQQVAIPDEEVISSDVKVDERRERRRISPKFIRGATKIALLGAVLGGVHIGANITTTQTLSGHTRGDIGQAMGDLLTDITTPLRMAVGK